MALRAANRDEATALSGRRLRPSPTLGWLEIDHVLLAVADLAAAAREMEEHHGLASIAGGRHPGWGTANRIVPLGETYLELVAVVDEVEARQSVFGRWVASGANISGRPIGWARPCARHRRCAPAIRADCTRRVEGHAQWRPAGMAGGWDGRSRCRGLPSLLHRKGRWDRVPGSRPRQTPTGWLTGSGGTNSQLS